MSKAIHSLSDIFSLEELKNMEILDLSPQKILAALEEQSEVEKAEYKGGGIFLVTPKIITGEQPFEFRIFLELEGKKETKGTKS